ncbi:hypothetical protein L1887_55292 [Cichorium endivia]|nr:hypothetical protein L1887_55292 [Cichorium endivia]
MGRGGSEEWRAVQITVQGRALGGNFEGHMPKDQVKKRPRQCRPIGAAAPKIEPQVHRRFGQDCQSSGPHRKDANASRPIEASSERAHESGSAEQRQKAGADKRDVGGTRKEKKGEKTIVFVNIASGDRISYRGMVPSPDAKRRVGPSRPVNRWPTMSFAEHTTDDDGQTSRTGDHDGSASLA